MAQSSRKPLHCMTGVDQKVKDKTLDSNFTYNYTVRQLNCGLQFMMAFMLAVGSVDETISISSISPQLTALMGVYRQVV